MNMVFVSVRLLDALHRIPPAELALLFIKLQSIIEGLLAQQYIEPPQLAELLDKTQFCKEGLL